MRRMLVVLPLAVLVAMALSSTSQAAVQTRLQTTVIGLPSTATLGMPIPMKVKVINRGPTVARGIQVGVGIDKDSGAGADPGLDVEPYGGLERNIAQLGVGRSKTFTFEVTIPATAPASQVGTFGGAYVGPGGYHISVGLEIRSPVTAKCTGDCTDNVSAANVTLTAAA